MFGRKRDARDKQIAAYVRALRHRNGGGMGFGDVARLARQDGRNYDAREVSRVMSDMSRGEL